ncbi:hypothetical protein J6590_072217 [Homalodisca vitripennis]|nr:hypothetical protein J6590_072217 [Homalodisca vitripennis]
MGSAALLRRKVSQNDRSVNRADDRTPRYQLIVKRSYYTARPMFSITTFTTSGQGFNESSPSLPLSLTDRTRCQNDFAMPLNTDTASSVCAGIVFHWSVDLLINRTRPESRSSVRKTNYRALYRTAPAYKSTLTVSIAGVDFISHHSVTYLLCIVFSGFVSSHFKRSHTQLAVLYADMKKLLINTSGKTYTTGQSVFGMAVV